MGSWSVVAIGVYLLYSFNALHAFYYLTEYSVFAIEVGGTAF